MIDNAEGSGKPLTDDEFLARFIEKYGPIAAIITQQKASLEAAEARIDKLKRQIAHYELETETVKEVKTENAKLRDDIHALLSAIDEYQHDVLETRGRNPSRWLEQVIERIDRVLKVED